MTEYVPGVVFIQLCLSSILGLGASWTLIVMQLLTCGFFIISLTHRTRYVVMSIKMSVCEFTCIMDEAV